MLCDDLAFLAADNVTLIFKEFRMQVRQFCNAFYDYSNISASFS